MSIEYHLFAAGVGAGFVIGALTVIGWGLILSLRASKRNRQ